MSYAHPQSSARRLTGLAVTVALHIVLVYALIHGLARKIVEVVRAPLETKIIEEIKPPPDKTPPPPLPKLATPPPPFIPPPEVNIQSLVQQAPAITVVTSVAPPPAPLAPTPPPQAAMQPETIADSCEKPPYPAAWRRAREEGEARVRLLIDLNGRVLESKIERSSGSRRIDDASREAALECKYRPGIGTDGKPMRAWVTKIYRWRLTDD